jgi:demethylmenaquinone methyltransferase/2-methoxy-6-polyprenyl-1,4-benzoquinol methylase
MGLPLKTISQHRRDVFIKEIFASIAPNIDLLSSFFSFGLDEGWRRKLVSFVALKEGDKVLDVCSGTGKLAFLISEKVGEPGSIFASDFSSEMLDVARRKHKARSSNITFSLSDAKNLGFLHNSFDAVTVAFGMRNIVDTAAALREAHRVLKPGGRFGCLELTSPKTGWVKPFYTVYCFNVMPFIAKKILKTDVPYSYLPRSIKAFPAPDEFKNILETCGFIDVTAQSMTHGIATMYKARKR